MVKRKVKELLESAAYINLEESFDADKLNYILEHEEFYRAKMRPKYFLNNKYKPFSICKKYLTLSRNGVIKTTYRQNNSFGRFYAEGSLSLQNMPREVRHTVSRHLYNDLDVKNAHPVILAFMCKKRGIKCSRLKEYIKNRDSMLSNISKDKDVAKGIVLSLINGGTTAFNALDEPYEWLISFHNEICLIHDQFARDPEFETFVHIKQEHGINFNLKAKYVNSLLCDSENNILMCIYKALDSPKNCVLVFDGIMIPLSIPIDLDNLASKVRKELGITIQLVLKPMNEGFTDDGIMNCVPYVSSVQNCFDYTIPDDYHSLCHDLTSQTFSSFETLLETVRDKSPKCITRIILGEGFFLQKNTSLGSFQATRHLKVSDATLKYHHKDEVKDISLSKVLCESNIPAYGRISCRLGPCPISDFNTWSGFQAVRVIPDPANVDALNMMKSFIFKYWANNDVTVYNYVISWFAGLVTNLTGINRVALAMISPQGYGKNTLLNFLEFILRKKNMIMVTGIEEVTDKFNKCLENKRLVCVNEMSSSGTKWLSNFDKLKSNITDTTLNITPKGVDSYQTDNIGNYLLFTQHIGSIPIESSDRRYNAIEMLTKPEPQVFTDLHAHCFNQRIANEFYTFLLDFESVDLLIFPKSNLKDEMKNLSKCSTLKFLDELACFEWMYVVEKPGMTKAPVKTIRAVEFYKRYMDWCQSNGERKIQNSTKFGTLVGKEITKKRTNKGMMYYFSDNVFIHGPDVMIIQDDK